MALSNYDELVKSVAKWSHRNDLGLLIPDFIALAETEMYSNNDEVLEIREEEKTATLIAVGTSPNESRFIDLPTDYVSQRDLRITVDDYQLDLTYSTPKSLIIRNAVSTGVPSSFTVTDKIELDIIPDQDYTVTMKYMAKPLQLSTSNQTNSVLTEEPNIYLYGALHQAFVYTEDDQEAIKYLQKFNAAIAGANNKYKKGRYGPTPTMKINGPTP